MNKIGIIYRAINSSNGKAYVGQTVRNLKCRMQNHKSEANNKKSAGYNSKFYRAIRKYGIETFEWKILCNVEVEELDDFEREQIKKLNSFKCGYNSTIGGQASRGSMSEEVRKKISASKLGSIPWNKGIPMSKEAKKKLSNSQKGKRKGIKRPRHVIEAMVEGKKNTVITPATRKKMSESHAGKTLPKEQKDKIAASLGRLTFYVYNVNNKLVGEWGNASQCARDLDLYKSSISKCLKGERKSHKGYTFRNKEV